MTISTELTAGAGFAFEDGVAAFYLASILTEGDLLGLPETAATTARFRRGGQGHPLADLILEGRRRQGETTRLDLQVTTTLRLTASHDKFADIVRRAWETITGGGFREGLDRVGAAARTIGEQPLHDLRFLCKAARFSADDADFEARADGFSRSRQEILDTVRELIDRATGALASMADARRLLRHFVLLRFVVLGDAAPEAHAATERLRGRLANDDPARAHGLWLRLLHIAQTAKATGGGLDRATLESELRTGFDLAPEQSLRADLDQMAAEADLALASIHDTIDGVRLSRDDLAGSRADGGGEGRARASDRPTRQREVRPPEGRGGGLRGAGPRDGAQGGSPEGRGVGRLPRAPPSPGADTGRALARHVALPEPGAPRIALHET